MQIIGLIRPTTVTEITADGADYPAAKAALEAQIPDGFELIGVRVP
jgi:hypothetical protein